MRTTAAIVLLGVTASLGACAEDRLGHGIFSTTNDRFTIERDPILVKNSRSDKLAITPSAPDVRKFLLDYASASDKLAKLETGPILSAPEHDAAISDYRNKGFNAARAVCDYALNLLGESHSNYRFLNQSLNVLAGAGASVMGIFKSDARSTAVYAVGTSLYQAWSQDFEEYAYLTATIGTVKKKVTDAQDKYRSGMESAKDQPKNWGDATLQITKYNDYCLATGMRSLIEEAVGKADVYFDPERKDVTILDASNIAALQRVYLAKQRQIYQNQIDDIDGRISAAQRLMRETQQAIARAASAYDAFLASKNPFAPSGQPMSGDDVAKRLAVDRAAVDAATAAGKKVTDPDVVALQRALDDDNAAAQAFQSALANKKFVDDHADGKWQKDLETQIADLRGQEAKARQDLGKVGSDGA